MKTNLLRQIAAVLAILMVLAPLAPLEAAKHRRKRSKGHISAAKIDEVIAKFTHDELASFPKGALGATIILSEGQFRGNGLRTALEKAARETQNAITRWPQASRLPEAMAHLPNQIPGLAITKRKQHDGSSYFAGTFTTPEGCVFCWTRTVVFVKDPWYVVRFTIEKCKDCPTPTPTATPTPLPHTPTPTPTPPTPTPTPTPPITITVFAVPCVAGQPDSRIRFIGQLAGLQVWVDGHIAVLDSLGRVIVEPGVHSWLVRKSNGQVVASATINVPNCEPSPTPRRHLRQLRRRRLIPQRRRQHLIPRRRRQRLIPRRQHLRHLLRHRGIQLLLRGPRRRR